MNSWDHPAIDPVAERLPAWVLALLRKETTLEEMLAPATESLPEKLRDLVIKEIRSEGGRAAIDALQQQTRPNRDDELEALSKTAEEACGLADRELAMVFHATGQKMIEQHAYSAMPDRVRAEWEQRTGEKLSDEEVSARFDSMVTMLRCLASAAAEEAADRETRGETSAHKKELTAFRKRRHASPRRIVTAVARALHRYGDPELMQPRERESLLWSVLSSLGEDVDSISTDTLTVYWSQARQRLPKA